MQFLLFFATKTILVASIFIGQHFSKILPTISINQNMYQKVVMQFVQSTAIGCEIPPSPMQSPPPIGLPLALLTVACVEELDAPLEPISSRKKANEINKNIIGDLLVK